MRNFIICSILACATTLHAQSFETASKVFWAAALADNATTVACVRIGCQETNPTRAWAQSKPFAMLGVATAEDAFDYWLVKRFASIKHPKLAAAGLYVSAGFRSYLVARTIQNYRITQHNNAAWAALGIPR